MSNYIFGYCQTAPLYEEDRESLLGSVREKTSLGFHILEPNQIPLAYKAPSGSDYIYFIISDDNSTLLASYLIFESDWADNANTSLPRPLGDRIALMIQTVGVLLSELAPRELSLIISESDQIEGQRTMSFKEFSEVVYSDFQSRGIPCLVYHIRQ